MIFFSVAYKQNRHTTELLEQACKYRSIRHLAIDPAVFNYLEAPQLKPGDLLYRDATDRRSRLVEKFLTQPDTATFYRSYERALQLPTNFSYLIHEKMGIPIPPTIYHITRDRALLQRYVDHLGGFPIILKSIGSSHGVGVMKIDSVTSLFSIADHLLTESNNIIMRKFIDTKRHGRFIVLGNAVIDTIEYEAPADDFRTNVGAKPNVKPRQYEQSVQDIAVSAVKVLGLEFGGVDVIFDSSGAPYVIEVNFPCNFARAQSTTGVDIAGLMVDYLMAKNRAIK
jgi:hypothetical protein